HCGYEVSQQKRKRVEEPFGWGKTIGGLARPMLRGVKKLDFKFTLTMAAYDLIKLPRLIGAAAWRKSIRPKQARLPYSEILIFPRDGYAALWANFQQPARAPM